MLADIAAIARAATLAVAALMPIVNPLGTAPIFLHSSVRRLGILWGGIADLIQTLPSRP